MTEKLFGEIFRILNEGGKLFVMNRKEQELDITIDYRIAFKYIEQVEAEHQTIINQKEEEIKKKQEIIKRMNAELSVLSFEMGKLREIKKIREDYLIMKQMYDESEEGMLVKKVMNKDIKDIAAIVKSYDSKTPVGQQRIYEAYDLQLDAKLDQQQSIEYEVKLDDLVEQFKKKYDNKK